MYHQSSEVARDVLEEVRRFYQAELGRSDIRPYYNNNQFDKAAFGNHCQCGFCNHSFNPFFVSTLRVKSEWNWQEDGPEKRYELNCPQCNEELRLTIFISQD